MTDDGFSTHINGAAETAAGDKPIDSKCPTCGIVMPLSAIDGCSESHWEDVRAIISDAIQDAQFKEQLVSDADDSGIIQKRIVQNLYDNDIVVCDVSGKNPNVMFELGMRLAFDKPTIVIKDDKTTYSFDTAPIEHIGYPRDLRFAKIIEFKQKLSSKIRATHKLFTTDDSYTTFLKHFGKFSIAKLDETKVGKEDFVLAKISELSDEIKMISRHSRTNASYRHVNKYRDYIIDSIIRRALETDEIDKSDVCDPANTRVLERLIQNYISPADIFTSPNEFREELRTYAESYRKELVDEIPF